MSSHAFLSASSSHRWLACPPSARLCEGLEEQESTYAKEGSEAHELCAYLVEKALGKDVVDPRANFEYLNGEMERCANDYADYVLEQYELAKQYCKDPIIFIEQKLDFSKYVKDGFGTGDCVIIADKRLHIIDYKHGLGVLVESKGNSQMMCYALGALDSFEGIYDIDEIEMSIFQPRKDNISSWTISIEELLKWGEEVLKPTALLAYEGKGEFKSGEHCRFCRAKAICRKRAEDNLKLAKYDFTPPGSLDENEIASLLEQIEKLMSWGEDVWNYALLKAKQGVKFKGYKLVEGRSNRKYKDEEKVAQIVKAAGVNPYEEKLLSITSLTDLLGSKKFNELLGELVYKPPGKPTLVKESDKRPELNNAINDFNDNN